MDHFVSILKEARQLLEEAEVRAAQVEKKVDKVSESKVVADKKLYSLKPKIRSMEVEVADARS